MEVFRTFANSLIKNRESEDFPEINKFILLKNYEVTGLRVICQVTSEKTTEGEELYNDIFMGFSILLPTFSGSIAYELENKHINEYGDQILEKLTSYPCMSYKEVQEQNKVVDFICSDSFLARDMAWGYASTYYQGLIINPMKTAEKFIEDFIKGDLEVQDEKDS